MAFVDFAELKERVSIETAVQLLELNLTKKGEQLRGPCPACNSGGDRALVVTPNKQAFYCFSAKQGGDLISLAAHIRGESMKDAAVFLNGKPSQKETAPEENIKEGAERKLQPLVYLQTEHETLDELGLSPETCEYFECGFASKGIMRGRLAIPIHDLNGQLVAYCGRALKEDQHPVLFFPKGFNPSSYVFNLHRADEGELTLVYDPLDVLLAYENGVEGVISLLHRTVEDNVVPLAGKRRA